MGTAMRYAVDVAGETVEVKIVREGGQAYAVLGDEKIPVELARHRRGLHTLALGRRRWTLWLSGHGTGYTVQWRGRSYGIELEPARVRVLRRHLRARGGARAGEEAVTAFMPGLVVKVKVEEGRRVRAGDGLAVISAMKMENEIRSPCDGVVTRIDVREGEEIQKGKLLCVIRHEE
jgi:pyruvate carboxylase subunit B